MHSWLKLCEKIEDFDFERDRFEWDIIELTGSIRRDAVEGGAAEDQDIAGYMKGL